jgi:Cu-Zn family superoxide dismutase
MQIRGILVLGSFLTLFIGCAPVEQMAPEPEPKTEIAPKASAVQKAVAVLHPTEGQDASGVVTFEVQGDEIRIVADFEGLNSGEHGFHIHEFGDCSAPDASSAGGHFNPEDQPHGAPTDQERHVGDLGNVSVDESGMGHYEWMDEVIAFSGAQSIMGRAVIVHAGEDDLISQPTGNAGARAACGVIGIAQP